jgi:hypothetical protein
MHYQMCFNHSNAHECTSQTQNSGLNGSHLHQCFLTHSKYTQPTQIKCFLTHSKCTQPTQIKCFTNQMCTNTPQCIKTYNVGICTHAHLMLQNTSKEHQSRTCAPPSSKWLAKPQSSFKALQKSSKAPKVPPKPSKEQTCTSNTHKSSRSLSMHTSNQTSNHATCMRGPITCWSIEEQ